MKKSGITTGLAVSLLILSILSLFIGVIDLDTLSLLSGDVRQLRILIISRLPRLLPTLKSMHGESPPPVIRRKWR